LQNIENSGIDGRQFLKTIKFFHAHNILYIINHHILYVVFFN